jgi:hypothetical protein
MGLGGELQVLPGAVHQLLGLGAGHVLLAPRLNIHNKLTWRASIQGIQTVDSTYIPFRLRNRCSWQVWAFGSKNVSIVYVQI